MTNWKYVINITDILRNYDTIEDEELINVMATKIAKRIRDSLVYTERLDLRFVLDEIIDCFEDAVDVYDFDDALDELYDLADMELIWIETQRIKDDDD